MKTIKTLLMALCIAVPLTACSAGGTDKKDDVPPAGESSEKKETAEEKTEPKKDTKTVTIEETVLLDEAGVKITAKSLENRGFYGPEVKLLIENTSGKSLTVQCRNSSVNGYMTDTSLSAEVADGKKANDGLEFMSSDLEEAGISVIADMEFSFHIFDSATWDTYLDSDTITLKTSAAEGYEYTYDDSGTPVYEGNGIRIIVKGLAKKDSWLGPEIRMYIENESGQNITVQARDVSVNGFMLDPVFSSDVMNGKRAADTMTFMSSQIEENDIEKIEDVELSFHIFNMDTWDTVTDTETVQIHF